MLTINDTHLGVNRSGGTTPTSYLELINYTRSCFVDLLRSSLRGDGYLLINGDLFDGYQVSNADLRFTYAALHEWLKDERSKNLYLARGNHDISKDSSKLSSFDLLASLLQTATPEKVVVITEPTWITWKGGNGLVLPHAPNQDIFEVWLQKAKEEADGNLFVHANYDNGFAMEKDHSLNVSADMCRELRDAGWTHIVFGHEHQQAQHGAALIVGNQFPTSISDCLGNDTKRAIRFDGLVPHEETSWEAKHNYFECDWRRISSVPGTAKFVRVVGEAEAEEAASVLESFSALRKSHSAFVISNAVKIDGQALDVSSLEAVEEVQQFDVLSFLYENFDDAQVAVLKTLAAKRNVTEQ